MGRGAAAYPLATALLAGAWAWSLSHSDTGGMSYGLIEWWIRQPGVALAMVWGAFVGFDKHNWVIVVATLIPALLLTAVVAGFPWGILYLGRWFARGFARD